MELDRGAVRELTDRPRGPVERLRAEVRPDVLVDIVRNPRERWWHREACARALAGLVPPENAEDLFALARDGQESTEIRSSPLDALATPPPVRTAPACSTGCASRRASTSPSGWPWRSCVPGR